MKALFGCCLTFIIIIAVIIGLIVGGVWYVSNMTLGELGLSEQVIPNLNMTIDELGLSDVKIKDIFTFLNSIVKGANEADIVGHPFSDQDLTNLENKLGGSNIIDPVTGKISFDNLEGGYVLFSDDTPITLKDTELAALFNMIIEEGFSKSNDNQEEMSFDGEEGGDPGIMISIREVKLTVSGSSGATMRTVIKFDISEIKAQLMATMPQMMQNYFQLGDALYIVTESQISANSEGKLQAGSTHTVQINNIPTSITNPFLLIMSNALASTGEFKDINGDPLEIGPGFFAEMVCGLFAELIYRFGRVGSNASTLGNSGFAAVTPVGGSITIVPWTALTVPVSDDYLNNVYQDTAKAQAGKIYFATIFVVDRVNNGDHTESVINSVSDLINYLNSQGITCVVGTEPVAGQTVIDIEFTGGLYVLNAVYHPVGSYTAVYINPNNVSFNFDESYVYPEVTRAQVDGDAALARAQEALQAALYVSYREYKGLISIDDDDIPSFINELNSASGLSIVYGTEAPTLNGTTVLNISFNLGIYDAFNAISYSRYSSQTATYEFNPD